MMFGLFGMKSSQVQRVEHLNLLTDKPPDIISSETVSVGNVVWTVLFGWWMSLLFLAVSGLLVITYFGSKYARLSFTMAKYIFYPFGKYIISTGETTELNSGSRKYTPESLLIDSSYSSFAFSSSIQEKNMAYFVWLFFYFLLIFPFALFTTAATWFFVVSVPISKVNFRLMKLLISRPGSISVAPNSDSLSTEVLLYCGEGFNRYYLNYSLLGLNIFFFNALPIVAVRTVLIILNLSLNTHLLPPTLSFILDLLCSIPLTYYIGTSIASITAQTNYMVGALLNASFGSLTEIILFALAMRKGQLNNLILYALTGGLLNDTLLIPGLSMIAGGLRFKSLKFNTQAAGVGSLLFYVAIIGAFTPTIFYTAFNGYKQQCFNCTDYLINGSTETICDRCYYLPISHDPLFEGGVATIIIIVMVLLPITYIFGMVFTFYTHADLFAENEEEEEAPEWSLWIASAVMSVSVITFGLIAEDLVEIIQEVLERVGISQEFLGVTLICLTPAATEIANAVRFAIEGHISLSVQIGSASAIQVALVQMPIISLLSYFFSSADEKFILIFPTLSIFAVILAVLTLVFVCKEGHTNYFIGIVLLMMYLILISSFYFIPSQDSEGGGNVHQSVPVHHRPS